MSIFKKKIADFSFEITISLYNGTAHIPEVSIK